MNKYNRKEEKTKLLVILGENERILWIKYQTVTNFDWFWCNEV